MRRRALRRHAFPQAGDGKSRASSFKPQPYDAENRMAWPGILLSDLLLALHIGKEVREDMDYMQNCEGTIVIYQQDWYKY